jgi:hypothetical protein
MQKENVVSQSGDAPRVQKWGAVAGLGFSVLFVLRFLAFLDTPDNDAPTSEWLEYFQDSGNRALSIAGAYVMVFSALAFLCFVWALRARLRSAESDGLALSTLVFGSGVAFVTMLLASSAAMATVPAGIEFGDVPVVDGEFARQMEQLGFSFLLLCGLFVVGVAIAATSASALRSGVLPRWLAISGFVVAAVVGLLGVFFIPMILLVLWVLTVSIVMLRQPTALGVQI